MSWSNNWLLSKSVVVIPIVTITTVTGTNQSAVNVAVNEELVITCNVKSYPTALVHWEENDIIVVGSSEVIELTVTTNSSVHGAIITYTCVAENVVGGNNRSVNNSITVYIQGEMLLSVQGVKQFHVYLVLHLKFYAV